ncbi:MAG: hypothetical protein EH225_11010 [Calditrichaeota bacterium]|nr:transglutaminase family protein [Calditrichota bacterium]RQV99706.1 MAG: hypothetical protein EH225_11010 [Calditrichota bacterium]
MIDTDVKFRHILKLLDDESPEIQRIIRNTLLDNSPEIILGDFLVRLDEDSYDAQLLKETLEEIHFDLVYSAFTRLFQRQLEDIDLEKAVLLLAFWNNPGLDTLQTRNQLEQLADPIRFLLPESPHPLSFIDHLSYYLFKEYGFHGNSADYYNPDNSFIDKVLENRTGIPISLSVLTMLVSARLQFHLIGVPMPAHFILKYENGDDEVFFDPFYGGKVYSRLECIHYLKQAKVENPDEILNGCTNVQILERMMRNIHLVYTSYKDIPQKAGEILQILELLEKTFNE